MFTHGQIVQRHEAEPWLAQAYPKLTHFKAVLEERPEPERGLIRTIVTLTGPNGEQLFLANGRPCVYYSSRPALGMAQIDVDWVS